MADLSKEQLLKMYKKMVLIRKFEDRIGEIYGKGAIPGEMHLSTGQEAVNVGVCIQLRPTDTVAATHRAHGALIAKGVNLNKMTAELFGREAGLCKGKGGHMHLFDPSIKFSCSGIVGASMPLAAGAALAAKRKGTDDVAVAFFGDGAANQGTFHESMNLAALWKLPEIFICEDNQFGISVRKEASTSVISNADRAASYGIPGVQVDGNDVIAVYEAVKAAIERARGGGGPTLIECKTYRIKGHFEGDPEVYKTKEEQEEWLKKDPIKRFTDMLLSRGDITQGELNDLDRDVKNEIEEAIKFAEESPWPKAEEALEDVFVNGGVD
ncbi:MAG: thiamine pyrophosphate-dependent dehydrogenase E1 component subunit alpha [Thermoanaerobacteraceae bacterium]|nr:thiamine pyrophosphate-dependent dehydrogenase E1 component subunit alpha [Thermoanaerobacteraceae bacterium]